MRMLLTTILLLPAAIAGAQTKQTDEKSKTDTLVVTTPALPAIVKHNDNLYQLKSIVPGVKIFTLDFTETVLAALLRQIELSNGSHYEAEQIKALIYEQLKTQVSSK